MNSERWQRINVIFQAAIELRPDERPAFLLDRCAGDDSLRLEIESLLAADDKAADFIETPALQATAKIMASSKPKLLSGQIIGHYEVLELIGRGGMGEVYAARDLKLGRKAAIKLLPSNLTTDKQRVRRFLKEARAISALNHPNIIVAYEIISEGDSHYIVTELVEGETLRQVMARRRLTADESLDIAIQLAGALEAAHLAGIVHRDIKPENIMLRPDGYIKVLDFGLAKLTEQHSLNAKADAQSVSTFDTDPGMIMGTIRYMSPEQARGLEVDFRTDFFSLGVVLYEVISGHHPFEGETPSDTFAALLTSDAPPLTKGSNSISVELERIMNKALSKDRTARYQSARDFLSDLESLRSRLSRMYGSSPSFEDVLVRGTRRAENISFIRSSFLQAVDKGKQIVQSSRFYKAAALLLALVMIAAWIASVRYQSAWKNQGGIRAVAVLPLAIESDSQDAEYLSEGLSETLINDLSRLPHLKVIARSSVYRYKGKKVEVKEVSRLLGVEAILMGRIVQQGENLSISIELIDSRNNIYLLKEQFEATIDTILEVQGRIARRASERLHIELNPEQQQLLSRQLTRSTEAYQLYLKGRYQWNRSTEAGLRKAIDLFNEAIVADPDYALAYAGLAESYASLAANYVPPAHVIPLAKAYARKAIALDETLPDAHYARALTEYLFEWDWPEAERYFKRTLELNPNHANALTSYAGLLRTKGELNEAVSTMQRALEIDPLSLRIRISLGLSYYYFRKYDEALAQFQVAVQIDPNFFPSYVYIGRVYLQKKQPVEAIGFLEKARDLSGGDPQALAPLARAYAASGRKREARELLDRIVSLSKQSYIRPHEVAMIYASLGQKEQALSWLEKAYEERSAWLLTVKLDPELDVLQPDPKFKDLLSRIGPSS